MSRVLVIDDDKRIRELLCEYLESNGYSVTAFPSPDLVSASDEGRADAIILDVSMPGMDGFDYLKSLRLRGVAAGVIMLTAMSDIECRVRGLGLGANDYIAKPFDPRELLYRLRNIVKPVSDRVVLGSVVVDLVRMCVMYDTGREILLSSAEARLFKVLLDNANKTVPRVEIAKSLFAYVGERSVDVQINRLRQKLEPDPKTPRYIRTVRYVGYMLVV